MFLNISQHISTDLSTSDASFFRSEKNTNGTQPWRTGAGSSKCGCRGSLGGPREDAGMVHGISYGCACVYIYIYCMLYRTKVYTYTSIFFLLPDTLSVARETQQERELK